MTDVSFIVVNWNTRDLTSQCIRSIQSDAGDMGNELIVVDNGSTDGSPEVIAARFPGVRLIRNGSNFGFAKANNIGIDASQGAFAILVNSDAELLKGCTKEMIGFMRTHPDVGILGPCILDSGLQLQRSCWESLSLRSMTRESLGIHARMPDVLAQKTQALSVDLNRHFLSGCVMCVRRKATLDVGTFDERFFFYCEDMDLCRRMRERNWRVVYLPSAKAVHLGGGSSLRRGVGAAVQSEKAVFQYSGKYRIAPDAVMVILRLVFFISRTAFYASRACLCFRRKGAVLQKVREGKTVIAWLLKRDRKSCDPSGITA